MLQGRATGRSWCHDLRSAPPGRSSRLRMALGAPSTGIAWMVLCESLVLVAAGVTAGVGTVLLAGRLVASRRLPISRPDAPRASTPDRAPGRVSPRTGRSSSLSRADLFQHAGRLGCIQKRRTSQPRRRQRRFSGGRRQAAGGERSPVPQPPARPARPLAGGQRVAGKGWSSVWGALG